MNRRNVIAVLALACAIALVVALILRVLSGPPANRILAAGDVRVQTRSVVAPTIQYPTMSYTVKVPSNSTKNQIQLPQTIVTGSRFSLQTSPNVAPSQNSTQSAQGQPQLAGRIAETNAIVGDHVTTGTVLAKLDTAMLDLGVQAAKLQAQSTKTTVRVLNNNIDTILDNVDKVETGKDKLATGKAQLAKAKKQLASTKKTLLKTRRQLVSQRNQLLEAKRNRPQLEAQLEALKAQLGSVPPGSPQAQKLQASIKNLSTLLASISPGLAKIGAGLRQIDAGLAKIAAGEAKLATAEAQLRSAQSQLNTAQDALDTAKTQATKARDYVEIISEGADIGVTLAEAKRDQATIVAPCSGVITQAMRAGQTALVGAPLFKIAPELPALVDTYLTAEQLGRVRLGSEADIRWDSAPGKTVRGVLHAIDSQAPYPPTSFPTDIVHMTHAVRVTFQLDSGDNPPAGTPVDIAIHTD
jgi:multidrug resistance efflux pump